MAGIIDPPREEVRQAVFECKTAGIKPVMITGDHPTTAHTIAKRLDIIETKADRIVTGSELKDMTEAELVEVVDHIKVYARVSPEQKLNIVKALQKRGEYVAMTGDGVNDAPALKHADIGVAMGITGTDVSKEAAHMILLDDNFATIVKAVKEGRRIFDNIRKFIRYVLTGNSAEIWTIFLAPFLSLPVPLLPIHILWINLVTDGLPGLALATEPPEKNIMHRPPQKPGQNIFAGGMGIHVLWVGLLLAALTIGTQAYAIHIDDSHWQTMVFTVLCLGQLFHVMAIRSENTSLFVQGIFSNKPLIFSVIFIFVLQLIIIYIPVLNVLFKTQPLSLAELSTCVGITSVVFIAVEIEKIFRRYKK
jgi:Ca2+-transporting ATPase